MSSKVFSDVKVYPVKSSGAGKLRANGSVMVANTVIVKFSVMDGKNGLFVSVPSQQYKDKTGKTAYNRHYYFPNKELMDELQTLVIDQYKNGSGGKSSGNQKNLGEENQDDSVDNIPF